MIVFAKTAALEGMFLMRGTLRTSARDMYDNVPRLSRVQQPPHRQGKLQLLQASATPLLYTAQMNLIRLASFKA
jgi:hypothetical protein